SYYHTPLHLTVSSLLQIPRPPTTPLFPYTTLFRSRPATAMEDRSTAYLTRAAFAASTTPSMPDGCAYRKIFSTPCSAFSNVFGSDRKSTRLNSSHRTISYAVFCLKKKNDYAISYDN